MNLSRHIDHSTAQPPVPAPMPMHRWLEQHRAARPGLLARIISAASRQSGTTRAPKEAGARRESTR